MYCPECNSKNIIIHRDSGTNNDNNLRTCKDCGLLFVEKKPAVIEIKPIHCKCGNITDKLYCSQCGQRTVEYVPTSNFNVNHGFFDYGKKRWVEGRKMKEIAARENLYIGSDEEFNQEAERVKNYKIEQSAKECAERIAMEAVNRGIVSE